MNNEVGSSGQQQQAARYKNHHQAASSGNRSDKDSTSKPSEVIHPVQKYFAKQTKTPMSDAFKKKASVHAGIDVSPVSKEQTASIVASLFDIPRQSTSVAYIHIPFCENHCLFCGFYQNKYKQDRAEHYVDMLIRELAMYRDSAWQNSQPLRAVYFGGGTPSALSADSLGRLLEAVHYNLPLAEDCEITIEGRVKNFDDEKIAACLDAGANRFSIGIQSFDDDLRKSQGRRATGQQAQQFLQKLVATDRATVVLDLLYGLPEQTLQSWQRDVQICIDSGVHGVDLYALTLIPGSPLHRKIELGKTPPAADIKQRSEFYTLGLETLRNAQWQQLSSCHFGRDTRERNLYNLLVKGRASCMPFGSGAGGTHAGYQFRLEHDLEQYQNRILAAEKPVAMIFQQAKNHDLLSLINADMERGFLHLTRLRTAVGKQLSDNYWQELLFLLEQYQQAGLIELGQQWLRLTDAGHYWQVTITQNLIEWMKPRLSTKNFIGE